MSLKQFYAELERGLPSPAYMLHSEDAFLLKEASLAARDMVPEGERDFKYHAFDLEATDAPPIERIIDVLLTIPFMGGRQVVSIEGMQKLKADNQKALASYLENPSPDSVAVMFYSGKPRKTMLDKLRGAKALALAIRERDLPLWIRQAASQKGMELANDAVEFMLATIGTDVGVLTAEVGKLAMLGRKKLTRKDVEDIVSGAGEAKVFDLADALDSGDAGRVMSVYARLAGSVEPYGLLGALNWHYERKAPAGAREEIFSILNEADLMVKSSGVKGPDGSYPLEETLYRLMKASSGRKRGQAGR